MISIDNFINKLHDILVENLVGSCIGGGEVICSIKVEEHTNFYFFFYTFSNNTISADVIDVRYDKTLCYVPDDEFGKKIEEYMRKLCQQYGIKNYTAGSPYYMEFNK